MARASTSVIMLLSLLLALLSIFGGVGGATDTKDIFGVVDTDSCVKLQQLLELPHIDINVRGSGGQTPLMYATLQGKAESVKCLLEHGADPTIPEKDGYPPMHGAGFQGAPTMPFSSSLCQWWSCYCWCDFAPFLSLLCQPINSLAWVLRLSIDGSGVDRASTSRRGSSSSWSRPK